MGSPTEASVLAALERAELAARERRLAASAEAERIVVSGRDRAARISAGADEAVAHAIDTLRQRAEAEADRAIDALEREAADRTAALRRPRDEDPAFEQAVELVVSLVLDEHIAEPGSEGRA